MKKNILLTLFCLLFLVSHSQQRKTIYISTQLPVRFKAYIDGQIQHFIESSKLKILNVPYGEKQLQIKLTTHNGMKISTPIGKNMDKEEYYKIEQMGDSYILIKNPVGAQEDKTFFTKTGYTPVYKAIPKDSTSKVQVNCQFNDSTLNKFILNLGSLTTAKAKKEFTLNSLRRKCLYTSQLKSIGYRLDDDEVRLDIYKIMYFPALDRNNFQDLIYTFQSQKYTAMFDEWLKQQK